MEEKSLSKSRESDFVKDARIEESVNRISRVLNLLEATIDGLEPACNEHGWDSGVVYQIQDAARSLGFSLATLNRWYDDDVVGWSEGNFR